MSERYVIKDRWIFDTKLNKNIHSIDCYEEKSVLDIMNGQDQRIAELEEQLGKWQTEYARAYVNRQNDLIAENVDLKKQLKNAIVLPKDLEVGNKIFWANEDGLYCGKIHTITKEENPRGGFNVWFYCVYDNGLTYWHLLKDFNNEVFATKAEAEAKLEELEGEKK